jgi:hypothetical protein
MIVYDFICYIVCCYTFSLCFVALIGIHPFYLFRLVCNEMLCINWNILERSASMVSIIFKVGIESTPKGSMSQNRRTKRSSSLHHQTVEAWWASKLRPKTERWLCHEVQITVQTSNIQGPRKGKRRRQLFLRARIMQQFLRAGQGPTWGKSWSLEGTSRNSSPIPPTPRHPWHP